MIDLAGRAVLSLFIAVTSAAAVHAQTVKIKCSDKRLENTLRSVVRELEFRYKMADEDLKSLDCSMIFQIRYVDLNSDGKPEIMLRGKIIPLCGGVGNCLFYVFTTSGRMLLNTTDYVDRSIMGKQVLRHRTRGYKDLLLTGHVKAGTTMFDVFKFDGRSYKQDRCPRYEVYDRDVRGKPRFKTVSCDKYVDGMD